MQGPSWGQRYVLFVHICTSPPLLLVVRREKGKKEIEREPFFPLIAFGVCIYICFNICMDINIDSKYL